MLQFEGSAHLSDFPQYYPKFNSKQTGAQSSEEGIPGLDQQYLASIHLADSVFSVSEVATTTQDPTLFANHSTVQLSPGNGEMLLQH